MAPKDSITKADLQAFLDALPTDNGFTGLDREALGALRAEVKFNTEAAERRLALLESEDKTLHSRINDERDKRADADGILHARVTNTRYTFIAVSAISGFIGGLFKVPFDWFKS